MKEIENCRSNYSFNILAKPYGPICNLNCDYCFYLKKESLFKHKKRSGYKINGELLEMFISKYIESQPESSSEVQFSWQGGEPTLLGLDFFKEVIKLQKKYNIKGINIINVVQTNGTLIDNEIAKFFREHNFLIGLSIDGPENLHNKYRKDIKGEGSFNRVMHGLEILNKHNVDFNTLTVVQNDNSNYPVEIYNFLKEIGSKYIQFIPIVEVSDNKKSLLGNRSVKPIKWGEFLTETFNQWIISDIGETFIQHFDLILGLYVGQKSTLCVHSKYCGKSMAMEHNGNIYSCDHFVTPENLLGNIKDNLKTVITDNKQIKFGLSKFDSLPDKCIKCKFLELCFGGCPKDRVIKTSTGNLNYLCKGYYNFYKATYPTFLAMSHALLDRRSPRDYGDYL